MVARTEGSSSGAKVPPTQYNSGVPRGPPRTAGLDGDADSREGLVLGAEAWQELG